MTKRFQAIRGMNDILPEATPYWRALESACQSLACAYGYREVRFPIVENTALFQRTIGDETDIVSKEMFTFEDRNGDSLTLRPEGTAACARLGIEHGLLYNQVQRFWYLGPMFRHERPQKGRYRQFNHFGVEAFGMADAEIDAEIIAMGYRLWQQLGLQDHIRLELNSLGSVGARATYRKELMAYLTQHQDQLDQDSQRRLTTNPLRILDSKNPAMRDLILSAPTLIEYLDHESHVHFDRLKTHLHAMNIPYEVNPYIVRGLDYYGSTVFEWTTESLGAQGTVCAGGRYDVLVEQLGDKPTPAIGFAMGLERIVLLLEKVRSYTFSPDIYFVLFGEVAAEKGLVLAEKLRSDFPELSVEVNASGGSFKSQFKRADKSGARWAFIIGDEELSNNTISIKNLREEAEQKTLSLDELAAFVAQEVRG